MRRSPVGFALYLLRWQLRMDFRTLRQPLVAVSLASAFLLQILLILTGLFVSAGGGLTTRLTEMASLLLLGLLGGVSGRYLESLFGTALGFLSLAPVPAAGIALFATFALTFEALAAALLLVLPLTAVLFLRFHSLLLLPTALLLILLVTALLMLVPAAINLLAIRLLPRRHRRWSRAVATLPLSLSWLLLPWSSKSWWPLRPVMAMLVETAHGRGTLLAGEALPLLAATVLMLLLAPALALSPLSNALGHLRHDRSPTWKGRSRPLPTRRGRLHFWLLSLTAGRQKPLLGLALWLVMMFLMFRFAPGLASGNRHGFFVVLTTGLVSGVGLMVFAPEGVSFPLAYLWPLPQSTFWRQRALWLLGQAALLVLGLAAAYELAATPVAGNVLLLALTLPLAITVWISYLALRFRFGARKGPVTPSRIVLPLVIVFLGEGASFLEMFLASYWPLLLIANLVALIVPFLAVPRLLAMPGTHRHPF